MFDNISKAKKKKIELVPRPVDAMPGHSPEAVTQRLQFIDQSIHSFFTREKIALSRQGYA